MRLLVCLLLCSSIAVAGVCVPSGQGICKACVDCSKCGYCSGKNNSASCSRCEGKKKPVRPKPAR